MPYKRKTPLTPTVIITLIYVVWAWGTPTQMGPGGYVVLAPLVAVTVYALHALGRRFLR